jgi:hypothetical protein
MSRKRLRQQDNVERYYYGAKNGQKEKALQLFRAYKFYIQVVLNTCPSA